MRLLIALAYTAKKTVHFVPFSNNRYWRVFYIMKLFSGLSNIQVLRSNIQCNIQVLFHRVQR